MIADTPPDAEDAPSWGRTLAWDSPIEDIANAVRRRPADRLSFDEAVLAGERLYQAEDWGGSALAFGRAVGFRPDDASLVTRMGLSAYRAGDKEEAESAFRRALQLDPNQNSAHAHLVEIATAGGDVELINELMQQRIRIDGETEGLLTDWTARLMRAGHPEEAFDVVTRAAGKATAGVYAIQLHAMLALQLGLLGTASRSAEKLWRADVTSSNNAIFFAQICIQQGRSETAVSVLRETIAAGATDPSLYRMLSGALVVLGHVREATQWAATAARLAPANSEYWYHLAHLADMLGYKGNSIEFLRRASQIEPGNPHFSVSLARALVRDGELEQAVAILDEACTIDSTDQQMRDYRLSILEQRTSDFGRRSGDVSILPLPRSRDRVRWGDLHELSPAKAFWAGLAIQLRVISALCVRQVSHLSLHSRFGLATVILEPLLHVAVMGLVLTYFNAGKPPLGSNLFFYYATGILPFLLFGHITDHSLAQYVENKNLLHVRLIKRIDFVIAAALTQLLVDGAACIVIFSSFWFFGVGEPVGNGFAAITGFGAIWLLALGFGLVTAAMNSLTLVWQKVWYSAQRLLYVGSGIFYLPSQLPDWFRDIVVWNPVLIGIEWIRTGFYPQYDPPWVDKTYLLMSAAVMITVGLILERILRPYARD